jgi:hypothetical protein
MDCFFLLVVVQLAAYYLFSDGNDANDDNSMIIGPLDAYPKIETTTNLDFKHFFEESPPCDQLDDRHVSFSLAIPLMEQDLHLVKRHCQRWGIQAPISIAVYTTLSPQEILAKVSSLSKARRRCHPTQLSVTTLIPTDHTSHYPIHELVNLAIQGAKTTHVIPLDIHMWSSMELYETLHSPKVVRALAKDPHVAIVLPAFEVDMDACLDDDQHRHFRKCQKLVPRNYDDLIVHLGQKEIFPMNPENYDLFGSTKYREWVTQPRGQLLDIDCVSSDKFQPFVVVRHCQGLPPFQENLDYDDDKSATLNDSTWIVHLIRLGYRMKQIGGEFVVYMSEEETAVADASSSSSLAVEEHDRQSENSVSLFSRFFPTKYTQKIRTRRRQSRKEFYKWLERAVLPDQRAIQACDDS